MVVVGLAAGWPRPPGSGDLAYTICSPRHHLLIEGVVSGQSERFATLLEVGRLRLPDWMVDGFVPGEQTRWILGSRVQLVGATRLLPTGA